ncbi:hypothetical protein F2Q69_00049172 [Brassica cretica]|uniref:Uncharacterized protein n=1 Tax=Brassica cretica TaxID=69181 RepID=A0A8S9Q703_BRACR|nr:hypothetical protein F2Q69_00049172 [Brassica cretica]
MLVAPGGGARPAMMAASCSFVAFCASSCWMKHAMTVLMKSAMFGPAAAGVGFGSSLEAELPRGMLIR